jgi:putative ABC transport system permease protein
VGPDYFEVMGIPLIAGRPFDERDRPDGARAAVVSSRLAERLWPHRDPIGQRLQTENTMATEVWYTVVGVAQPILQHDLDAAPGFDLYMPFTQASTAGPYYVVRTRVDPWSLANAATGVVGQIDPNQSFLDVASYERRIANRIWQRRLAGALLIGFAALAVVLASVGLYSVLTHIVLQQRREIGVRVALGATARDVLAAVLGRGLALAGLGAAAGIPLAFGLARTIQHVLFEVPATDPATFVATPVALLIVGGLACYLPARRAARLDPLVALRGV